MRGTGRVALAAALVLALGAHGAHGATGGQEQWTLTPGGWVAGPVEYVGTVPFEAATGSSAKLHRRTLYVTTFRSYSIYDVSNAAAPVRLSTVPLGVQLYNEQPDTNGKILLLAADFGPLAHEKATYDPVKDPVQPLRQALMVVDVRDKANPKTIGSLPLTGGRQHMWTCVLDCAYAYSAGGAIVDLSDPTNPTKVGDWMETVPRKPVAIHAVEEVAPGRVMIGASEVYYLDAKANPAKPTVLAHVSPELSRPGRPSPPTNPTALPAHVEWPDQATNRWMVMSMETPFIGQCDGTSGGVRTYDTTDWDKTGTFRFTDEYAIASDSDATYTNGRSKHHVFGCSAYVIGTAEHFQRTGQVAASWFEDGVRLLQVDQTTGAIRETGGFLPLGGSSATPIWRNDEIVYSIDLYRGIDILRVRPEE